MRTDYLPDYIVLQQWIDYEIFDFSVFLDRTYRINNIVRS